MDTWKRIYDEIIKALYEIGYTITGDAKRMCFEKKIYAFGDFERNIKPVVSGNLSAGMRLQVGSNVAHEPYVLGGKQPSWTPFVPILAWVEKKGLEWVDKRKKVMTAEQIAWTIIHFIKREGIPARNIFAEILTDRKSYVMNRLQRIGA